MEDHLITNFVIFLSIFLTGTAFLHLISSKFSLPYTVALFLIGSLTLIGQEAGRLNIPLKLPTQIIYFIFLPLLLFESSMHIRMHEFKVQFWTISWIATFGMLVSLFTIAILLPITIGIPFETALLFGAVISATDPVAVLALFKSIKVPKRLALLVDGESMFNDGTGVILFKLISGFVLAESAFSNHKIAGALGDFSYLFFGSIFFGVAIGFIFTHIIRSVKEEQVVQSTLTIALAISAFVVSERLLHLSGVITTVLAGITFGNLGKTFISSSASSFIDELWDYISFISNSIIFFFIGLTFNFSTLFNNPTSLVLMILIVLFARTVAVYSSFFITNKLKFFKSEPNVPVKWQHLINWGGLRGTIPIILVFTIPEAYAYKDTIITFTLTTVFFTLVINGTTCSSLLKKLGLHLPKKEEQIIENQEKLFDIEEIKNKLKEISRKDFSLSMINSINSNLEKEESKYRKLLAKEISPEEFLKSLRLHALEIESRALNDLYKENQVTASAYYEFDSELDLQHDFLEYKETKIENLKKEGYINASTSYRKKISKLRKKITKYPFLHNLLRISADSLILDRYSLLRARIMTSEKVLGYLEKLNKLITEKKFRKPLKVVYNIHSQLIKKNKLEQQKIKKLNHELIENYEKATIDATVGLPLITTGH